MSQYRTVAVLTLGKRGKELDDAAPKVNRQREDCSELDDYGVHLPISVGKADVKQRFRDTKMSSGADWQKFGEALDDAEDHREQIVVQNPSARVSSKEYRRKMENALL